MSKKAIIVSVLVLVVVAALLAIGFSKQNTPQNWWSVEFAQPSNEQNHDFIITNTNLTSDFTYTITATYSNTSKEQLQQKAINIAPNTEEVIEFAPLRIDLSGDINEIEINVTNGKTTQTLSKNLAQ